MSKKNNKKNEKVFDEPIKIKTGFKVHFLPELDEINEMEVFGEEILKSFPEDKNGLSDVDNYKKVKELVFDASFNIDDNIIIGNFKKSSPLDVSVKICDMFDILMKFHKQMIEQGLEPVDYDFHKSFIS